MRMYKIYMLACSVWMMGTVLQCESAAAAADQQRGCFYLGKKFQVNDIVTDDGCDDCRCTQFGIMCQLRACPPTNCSNPVRGECCLECPKTDNPIDRSVCHYGDVVVPKTGCLYADDTVCYCHQTRREPIIGETMCFPPFPMSVIPACNPISP